MYIVLALLKGSKQEEMPFIQIDFVREGGHAAHFSTRTFDTNRLEFFVPKHGEVMPMISNKFIHIRYFSFFVTLVRMLLCGKCCPFLPNHFLIQIDFGFYDKTWEMLPFFL